MKQDAYVDPSSCFVYVASVTRQGSAENYNLGNPTSPSSTQFSNNTVNSGGARKFLLYRVNNDLTLNAASSSCPTPSSLPSATTPVSIAGNGSELGYYVHSGVSGWGEWRMKYSSASTPVEHDVAGVIDMSYGADSQCVATATGVQCKGYQGGGLGDAANTTNTTSYVTVDTLTAALDVSVGSDFVCALDGSGKPYCWGSGVKGRLGSGIGSNPDKATPFAVATSTLFARIESGKAHTCALTSAGAVWCWGDNTDAQMAEDLWNSTAKTGTKSNQSPQAIAEMGSFTISKVSIGPESDFTAALIDNGSIAVWGTYQSNVYTDHFVLNSGVATDVAAGTDHVCHIESGAVTCTGDNSAGQTTVPTLSKTPASVYAGADWSCAGFEDGTYTCWGSKAGW
jgi:alpha-tubulin suppressor-like RCC1 family protein